MPGAPPPARIPRPGRARNPSLRFLAGRCPSRPEARSRVLAAWRGREGGDEAFSFLDMFNQHSRKGWFAMATDQARPPRVLTPLTTVTNLANRRIAQ